MISEIQYKGLSSIPNAGQYVDGELEIATNLINSYGGLRPISAPKIEVGAVEGYNPVCAHADRFIYYKKTDRLLKFLSKGESELNENAIYLKEGTTELYQPSILGNILILPTDKGTAFLLWKSNEKKYNLLGYHLPELPVEFILQNRTYDYGDTGYFSSIANDQGGTYGSKIRNLFNATNISAVKFDEEHSEIQKNFMESLTAEIEKCTAENLFTQPFFVRYAMRLYDGSYIMQSAPILMIPNSSIFAHIPNSNSLKLVDNMLTIKSRHLFDIASLGYRVGNLNGIKDWEDIVTHIDIFVSNQIYTYKNDEYKELSLKTESNIQSYAFSHIASGITRADDTPKIFSVGSSTENKHNANGSYVRWKLPLKTDKEMIEELSNVCNYYKIAEIPISELKVSDSFTEVSMKPKTLTNLIQMQALQDDYQSHHTLFYKSSYAFNSRLNVCAPGLSFFEGFNTNSMTALFKNGNTASDINIYVKIKTSYGDCWKRHSAKHYDIDNNFPRWLYYPDARANRMLIQTDTKTYDIALQPHRFLNGAYWTMGLNPIPELPSTTTEQLPQIEDFIYPQPSKVYTSEVGIPFLLHPTSITTIGGGEVLYLASATTALSQGQFGQFPLYAFTTEGIWALATNSIGTYSSVHPISRDVAFSNAQILSLDNSLLFFSDNGVMMLAGSQTMPISEVLDSENLSNQENSFRSLLPNLRGAYDYSNQRVFIYDPSKEFTYIYSLKSKLWTTANIQIKRTINTYPDAMIVDSNNRIINLSQEATTQHQTLECLIQTRPISLGDSNTPKTIRTIIQRGKFNSDSIKETTLYASNDLYNWTMIAKSNNDRIEGVSGSPWRYFKISTKCELSQGQYITSASVAFIPKLNNKLR